MREYGLRRKSYFIIGDGVFHSSGINCSEVWKDPGSTITYYQRAVRGNNQCDIVSVGAFGEVMHFKWLLKKIPDCHFERSEKSLFELG